ncbi:MAG: polysaccharide biosynthesis tyrosine autokinase [Gammaproteobacteria bacterium]|nr:polysaccharide biosynthesis tyrosine autokinase [Gammaproteobacteria bacterium]
MTIIEKAIDKLEKKSGGMVGSDSILPQQDVPSDGEIEKPLLKIDLFQILEKQGLNLSVIEKQQLKEEFRHIKRPLLRTAAGLGADVVDNGNVIMVASTKAGEGKTFTAINLAFSIAMEKEKSVLLIDADVEKSALSGVFGVKGEQGLVEYLLGETEGLSDVIFNSSLNNLKIMPAGKRSEYSTELFSSQNMLGLMTEISQRYDDRIVIVDLPPFLMTTEAIVLASMAGQIVMVVEVGSSQSDVKEAIGMLDSSMIVGLVLNKFNVGGRSYYYGGPASDA